MFSTKTLSDTIVATKKGPGTKISKWDLGTGFLTLLMKAWVAYLLEKVLNNNTPRAMTPHLLDASLMAAGDRVLVYGKALSRQVTAALGPCGYSDNDQDCW